ncbi:gamma-glutamylcyclotransferase [Marinobacter vulgaris]|uniref:Gamma-glutamylcyclotransferase n=1 Tax=Marinobacter vulgaris TaxID=1928331 RepID=A0A2V3ZVT6_9GAMM|nr:gamma-glutamylcyclotransferase family protein [Marinobacter vulgaris]PXX89602.1 gamma-glutamylcyclotransferase [Marinobacter vulgaris]TSJ68591.1 gamma-glutamylcyclotransferase [Marinobacter vulgaris]
MKKPILYTLAAIATLIVLGIGYLWLTFASPYGYNPTGDLPDIDEDATYSVFVYGTLTEPWVRWLVMGRAGDGEPAKLPGFRKEELDIKPVEGAVTEGQVITVNAEELRALDRYERLGVRYERVQLTLQDGDPAWVYRLMEPLVQEFSEEMPD